jgi:hypothetical protein
MRHVQRRTIVYETEGRSPARTLLKEAVELSMKPQAHDPSGSLSYLWLLDTVFSAFRELSSHEQLVQRLGPANLSELTDVPELQVIEAVLPLLPGHVQRTYQFRDASLGRGVMDAVFHRAQLVNLRAQLFFRGWFPKSKGRKYLDDVLVPWYRRKLGEPSEQHAEYSLFKSAGLVGVARYVPGTPSVSAHLTDQHYA